MTIRPIDIQTSIVGSQSVSEARIATIVILKQLHQMNPNGEIEEIERKAKEEVKESEAEEGINPEQEKEQQEQEGEEVESNDETDETSQDKKVISDGIRGRKLDLGPNQSVELHFGYLQFLFLARETLIAGLLVVDENGFPLDFRFCKAVKPNPFSALYMVIALNLTLLKVLQRNFSLN